ncbi:MAG TPA: hypothetical protein VGD61_17630 [Pyrinomonadaceae bacterium]
MKRFLMISLAMLGLSISLKAQEHSPRPSATPSSTPAPMTAMDSAGWVKFTSDTGNFSVMVPETPTEKTETTESQHGPYTTHLYIVRDTTNVYLIGWVDYDPSFNFNRQAELEANRDNFVKGLSAKLLTTRPTVIDGYSAIEFTAETTDRIFKSRVYMVGRRPYQIVIGSPKGTDDVANTTRFFRSFKVSAN